MTALNLGFSSYKMPASHTVWYTMAHNVVGVKIVRHWGVLTFGAVAFVVAYVVTGNGFTAKIVFSRLIEAIGDVAFDRGFTPEE